MTEGSREVETNGQVGGPAALESVRRLEETLRDGRDLREAARERVEGARKEAERIVREAEEQALRVADERRSKVLERAEEEAGRILEEARKGSSGLLSLAEEDRAAAAGRVMEWLVPRGEG